MKQMSCCHIQKNYRALPDGKSKSLCVGMLLMFAAAVSALAQTYTGTNLYTISAPTGFDIIFIQLGESSLSPVGHGQVIGYGSGPATTTDVRHNHALFWSAPAGSAVDLNPQGCNDSVAWGVLGGQQVGACDGHALLWSGTAGSSVDLHPSISFGFDQSRALAVADGHQVGYGILAGHSHAALWSGSPESIVDLNPVGFAWSAAYGTAGNHQVGYGSFTDEVGISPRALLWSSTAESAVDLNPAGFGGSYAYGVDAEQQVGSAEITEGSSRVIHAHLWSGSAASAVDLHGALSPGLFSFAYGVSRRHQVGFTVTGGASNWGAVAWSGTAESVVDLHNLLPDGFIQSWAHTIDVSGNIFGIAKENGTGILHAVKWTPDPLQLASAVSRKTHGAESFDINLPLTGQPGVECRSSGGNHKLVFIFTNLVENGSASVTTGTGSVLGSPTFDRYTMTANLTGVADVQKITVTLSNVTDSFSRVLANTAVSMNMLVGDTSGNKTVNGTDVSQTKLQSGAAVSAVNFREDVNAGGSINGTDVSIVKSRSGSGVP